MKKQRVKLKRYILKVPTALDELSTDTNRSCYIPFLPVRSLKYYKVISITLIEKNYLYCKYEIIYEKLQNLKSYTYSEGIKYSDY